MAYGHAIILDKRIARTMPGEGSKIVGFKDREVT